MIEIREYLDEAGKRPFADWFNGLDAVAAAKVTVAVARVGQGNFSSVKGVGEGVQEYRIDFGPGYRVYFGEDGDEIVLLYGGDKDSQVADIRRAKEYWEEYNA